MRFKLKNLFLKIFFLYAISIVMIIVVMGRYGATFSTLFIILFVGGAFMLIVGVIIKRLVTNSLASLNSMKEKLSGSMSVLREEKQKLSAILSGIYDGVLAIDHHQNILLYNDPILKVLNLGMMDQTIIGKKLFEVIRFPEVCAFLETSLSGHKIYQKQIKLIHETEKYYEIIVSPLVSFRGDIIGAVSIFHDITELKKVEQMRVDFVANVSHELKTPLTAIRGYTDTLLQGGLNDKHNNESFVNIIKDNVFRLSGLVEDLLTLSHLEASETVDKREIEVVSFVDEGLAFFKPLAQKKEIRIETDIQVERMRGDYKKLEHAFSNLLDNAIKYTPRGGEIRIRVSRVERNVNISVSDTGVGISPEHLPRIFERFYRVDPGRSRELGGTGLGLSIVKHVALSHDGYVDVESKPGQGSTFNMVFPHA